MSHLIESRGPYPQLFAITNHAAGLSARVTVRTDGRYAVTLTLLDLDAEETVPFVNIFDTEAAAEKNARYVIGNDSAI